MCGIGGKISFSGQIDPGLGKSMTSCMAHRGPDAEGIYANGSALLAHRRLSILDLSAAGHQPMANEDETVHVVFNGEIYNYRELRADLNGHTFTSETDTEVLVHLYEEEGVECVERLRGMFAFAIWDERKDRLFLARDRLGQKPLFYRHDDDAFWFGSTIKTILADRAVEAAPDPSALRQYLTYQYVPAPKTGFQTIRQLEPAEYMLVTDEGVDRDTYWSLSFEDQSNASSSQLAEQLRDKLRDATRLRMRSDVPVGVFLSGGIDSSVVTALMDEVGDDTVNTYSIGFENDKYDELEFAREVAETFDTNHHEYTVSPDSAAVIPELVEHYEMPFGDPSALPTYCVSQLASDDTTVVLGGVAGDENFAGYNRYIWDQTLTPFSKVPEGIRSLGAGAIESMPRSGGIDGLLHSARRGLEIADSDPVTQYARLICHATGERASQVWNGPVLEDELAALRDAFEATDGATRLDRLLQVDFELYLPNDLLVKIDRASMAHSLEVRSPFLDHELVEFAARIPAKYKIRDGDQKWLLKRAFHDVLPEKVLTREKQGFSVPTHEYFRGPLRGYARDRLDRLGTRDLFDRQGLMTVLDEHVTGRNKRGNQLWDLVILSEWYDRFIG